MFSDFPYVAEASLGRGYNVAEAFLVAITLSSPTFIERPPISFFTSFQTLSNISNVLS